jgi:hypothetical protein
MKRATRYTKAWAVWGAATALSFAVIETKAIRTPSPEARTLSAITATIFGFDEQGPQPAARRGLFYLLWGWFGLHILRRTTRCVSCINPPIPTS